MNRREGKGMIKKRSFLVLAVGVLMGTMAVAAFAEAPVMEAYESGDSSISSQLEQGAEQPYAGEIREPVETGAVPDRPESSSGLHSNAVDDQATVEFGGQPFRPDIDLGP
jgi:hypothetical protein